TIKILGVPTLITTDPSITELQTITEQKRRSLFSINNKTNLPGNIIEKINTGILGEGFVVEAEEIYENGAIQNTDVNGGETSILLYEGTIEDLSNETIKTKVGENIISYYTGVESTLGNLYQDIASSDGEVVLDALISNRQGGLNSKDVSLSSNTNEEGGSSSGGGSIPLVNYFSGDGTTSDPYRLGSESVTDISVLANNCNYYNVNATTLNNGTARGTGTCGVMGSGDKACLSDGIYMIDNDGPGGNNAFKVYCDMTTDEGGWTMVVRGIKGSNGHRNGANVGTLVGPSQTTVYKLSDSLITSITQNIYRAQNDQGINEYTVYFQIHDGFKSTSISFNGSKKTYLGGTWSSYEYNSSHFGFNSVYGFSYAHMDNFGEKTGVRIGGIGFSEWRPSGTGNNAVIYSK
ncbi:MAG: fibrinogen-like YCDxxxxGGGW domain-containing protein, partial [Candidatus Gracilibacteria bacterium]|nr:fibrinogen-like YCDxxxxGGGW domain-containing protein [Candidatus Gracilibacteria bacterium]